MDIVLFTNFFPYERPEPFLVNEFEFTRKYARSLAVFPLYGKKKSLQPENTVIFTPLLPSAGAKIKLFAKGIFNLAPFGFHASEFFRKKIFLSPQKLYWLGVSCLMARMAQSSRSYRQLADHINGLQNPVLYFYWSDNLTCIIPYLVKRLQGKRTRIVIRFHGSDLYEELKSNYAPLRETILRHAKFLCPVSEYGAQYLRSKYPLVAGKIMVSRLGVGDRGINPMGGSQRTVISVSNVVPVKRVPMIFDSLQECSGDITWHHFGAGPLLEQLKLRSKGARPGLRIFFHGYVPNEKVIEFLTTEPVNLFINTSSSEGVPVSVMEALSAGIPVLATRVGGVGELVNDRVGKIVEPEISAESLALEISRLLEMSENEIRLMRENARAAFMEKASADINYPDFYRMIGKS
jgi:glycosyltransferase involved in cell wall biosynthesis